MDPLKLKEVMDFLVHGRLPGGASSTEKYVIKRRAGNFLMKGKLEFIVIACLKQWYIFKVQIIVSNT